jgi:sec-independent protein translocase protein TatA
MTQYLLFLNLGGGELIMILLVVLLLFGGKGVPTIARTLGRSIREFKDAANGIQQEVKGNFKDVTNEVEEQVQEVKRRMENPTENDR